MKMHRYLSRGFVIKLVWPLLLLASAGCIDRGIVRLAPTAGVPCPPWVESADPVYLGCTNEANLRNMLANPDDLAQGRTLGPASGERETLGVDRYNKGKSNAPKNTGSAAPTVIMPNSGGEADQ
jgi:type IV pilus biogenesis protein CpaD/CtpE